MQQPGALPELQCRTLPCGNNDVQIAVRQGLGIRSTTDRNLFELNRDGFLPDMNSFLRVRMPQHFNHLAKNNEWMMTVNRSNWTDGDRD